VEGFLEIFWSNIEGVIGRRCEVYWKVHAHSLEKFVGKCRRLLKDGSDKVENYHEIARIFFFF